MRRLKKVFVVLTGIVLALSLFGCGILLEDRTFALSLAVDYKENEYFVWYGISDLSDEVSEEGENQVKEKTDVGYRGKNLKEIKNEFLKSQENELDMGHLKALILGKGILEDTDAYQKLLKYLEEQPAVASNVLVFRCEDIEALMQAEKEQETPLGIYLTKMQENKSFLPVKLQEVYRLWYNEAKQPVLPEIEIREEKIIIRNNMEN